MKKYYEKIVLWIFIFFTVFSTLAIDVKLTRYKLFAMELSIILLIAIWLVKAISSGKLSIRKNHLNLPVLSYFLLVAVFYFISTDKAVARMMFESMLFCFLVYFGAANSINDSDSRRTILKVWFIASVFVGLHGLGSFIAQSIPANPITGAFSGLAGLFDSIGKAVNLPVRNFFGFAHFGPNNRPFATFGNPNFFAAYLIGVLPVFTALLFVFKKKYLHLNIAVISLLLFNLWCTATRGAWLGFVASVVVFVALLKPKWSKVFKSGKGIIIFLLILLVFAGVIVRGGFITKFIEVAGRPTDRLLIWRDTLVMGLKKPLGVGLGAFHIYFPRHASEELKKRIPQNKFIVNYTHNEYLQVLSEMGIVGLAVFIWMIYAFFSTGIRQLNSVEPGEGGLRYMTIGFLSGGAGILVHNFFSVSMRFIVASIYLFFMMGVMASCGREKYSILKLKKNELAKRLRIKEDKLTKYLLVTALLIVIPLCWFSVKKIIQPFTAHKQLSEEIGFFEEKVVSPRETIDRLLGALKEDPDNADLHYRLAWVYSKEKNMAEAVKHFEATVAIAPELEGPYNNLGNIYFLTGKTEKAIENYKKAIEINPGKVDAHFNLGYIYYTSGKLKEASDEFNKILEMDPKNYKAMIMLEKMVQ